MNKEPKIPESSLIFKIENKRPIELIDLTKSLISLSNQFSNYVFREGNSKEEREAKLYIKEIKSGSVIIELIEYATVGMIPFIENINTIVGFADNLKRAIKYYLTNEGEKPETNINDLKEFYTILNPVAKDNGSQMFFQTTINGNVIQTINLNFNDTNTVQNRIKQDILELRTEEILNDTYERVALKLYQARSDLKSKTGNKGIIEEISEKPLNIYFNNDEIKEQILQAEINPLKSIFIVDVKIINVDKKPAIYKILKLHESFEIE
jgi:hypothetical protein